MNNREQQGTHYEKNLTSLFIDYFNFTEPCQ